MPPPRDLKKYTPRSFDEDGNETTTKIEPRNSTTKRADRGGGGGSGNEGIVQARSTQTKIPKRINSTEMLEYPKDIGRSSGQGHYIIFDILTFDETGSNKPKEGREEKYRSSLLKKTKRVKQQIALYMPENVDVAYATKYNDLAVGAFAELAAPVISSAIQNLSSGAGVIDQGKTLYDNTVTAVKAGGKGALADSIQAAVVKSARAFEFGSFKEGTNLTQQGLGKVITDKMEFFFEGVGRRTFSYTFNFIPTSQPDSTTIFKIIEAFKMGMLPDYSDGLFGGGTKSRTLTIPDIFDIKYMHIGQNGQAAENRYLNRVSTCHLTNMSVKYGDERYTTYTPDAHGAPPQKSSITLQFTEIEIVTKEAAKRGF
jgi:hypothetical protein